MNDTVKINLEVPREFLKAYEEASQEIQSRYGEAPSAHELMVFALAQAASREEVVELFDSTLRHMTGQSDPNQTLLNLEK